MNRIASAPSHLAPRSAAALALVLMAIAGTPASLAGEEDSCLAGRIERSEAIAAGAPGSDRYDETTGKDLRNFPPDRLVDFRKMLLEIDIPDMGTPRLTAKQTMTVSPIGKPLDSIRLDAVGMDIGAVTRNGAPVDHSYDGQALTLRFDPPLPVGQEAAIVTEYTLDNPADGLFWAVEPPTDAAKGAARAPQVHTQGEAETNRFWFPCHDSPNARMATELVVTVPEGFIVSSNGALASQKSANGRTTFDWRQDKPHASYLVSLVVGKFDVVDVAGKGDRVPLPVYVPPGKGNLVKGTYGRTGDMIKVFEERFGEPYPWARYAQLLAWNFAAGGMENTSATTMYDTAVYDEKAIRDKADMEGLISHELGHQWFGDLITCKSWEHIWLNEGFATYCTALWLEARDGPDEGYLGSMWGTMRGLARGDRLSGDNAADRPGMVSHIYEGPDDPFRKRSNPYGKGASILHMLRAELGDDLFFAGLRSYVQQHKFGVAETVDLRHAFEDVSGRSLERFFEQWCYRPGTPQVTTRVSWDEKAKALKLVVEQTQKIEPGAPAFAFTMPVYIEGPSGKRTVEIAVTEKRHERTIELPEEPKIVAVDPWLRVLMTPTVKQSASRFIEQLRHGPTMPARLDAATALREQGGPKTIEALRSVLEDTSEPHRLREAAADALGALKAVDALQGALKAGIEDPRVRENVVQGIGSCGGPDAVATLAEIARSKNEAYSVRTAAIRGLGEIGGPEHAKIFIDALDDESQGDQVRQAALSALGDIDEEEGLKPALKYIGPAYLSRTRATAFDTVGKLAHHDKKAAYAAVAPLLWDPVPRARSGAGNALVKIEDERGVKELRKLAETHPLASVKKSAERWADRLAGATSADAKGDLQKEVGRLAREIDKLKKQVEKSDDKKTEAASAP